MLTVSKSDVLVRMPIFCYYGRITAVTDGLIKMENVRFLGEPSHEELSKMCGDIKDNENVIDNYYVVPSMVVTTKNIIEILNVRTLQNVLHEILSEDV